MILTTATIAVGNEVMASEMVVGMMARGDVLVESAVVYEDLKSTQKYYPLSAIDSSAAVDGTEVRVVDAILGVAYQTSNATVQQTPAFELEMHHCQRLYANPPQWPVRAVC